MLSDPEGAVRAQTWTTEQWARHLRSSILLLYYRLKKYTSTYDFEFLFTIGAWPASRCSTTPPAARRTQNRAREFTNDFDDRTQCILGRALRRYEHNPLALLP